MENWKVIYWCEDSVEGILSGIYKAWSEKKEFACQELRIPGTEQTDTLELFAEYRTVSASAKISEMVIRTLQKRFPAFVVQELLKVAMSAAKDRADVLYRVMQNYFRYGVKKRQDLTDPLMMRQMEIIRNYGMELHQMYGFLRFQQTDSKALVAVFSPKNQILPGLMEHFADRMGDEDFLIVDQKHNMCGIHFANKPWTLRELTDEETRQFEQAVQEKEDYKNLWKIFFQTIAIQERTNPVCQRNHCPIWYRTYMPEFSEEQAMTSH